MFSESESNLAFFLAFLFIFTLGCLIRLGRRRRDNLTATQHPHKIECERITCNHCPESDQDKKQRPPEENDDNGPYNSCGTLFQVGFLQLLALIQSYFYSTNSVSDILLFCKKMLASFIVMLAS